MPYITILDFSTGEVHIHPYNDEDKRDANEMVSELGYREGNCQYMCTNELKLKVHEKE